MPLVVLTGGPCVGKSVVATRLGSALEADGWRVVVVSDDSLRLPRHSLYASAGAEKQGRSAVIAAVERALSATTVVIVDAMNYIKGFRYQLWCTTKGGLGPSCVVHVAGSLAAAEAANAERHGTALEYPAASIPAIWRRLEAPSEADRWELPLFTVDAGQGEQDEPAGAEPDEASGASAFAKAPAAASSAFARAPAAASSAFARAPAAASSAFAKAPAAASSAFARAPAAPEAASSGGVLDLPRAADSNATEYEGGVSSGLARAESPSPSASVALAASEEPDALGSPSSSGGPLSGAAEGGADEEPAFLTRATAASDVEMRLLCQGVCLAMKGGCAMPSSDTAMDLDLLDDAAGEAPAELSPDSVVGAVTAALARASPGERLPVPGCELAVILARVPTRGELTGLRRSFAASSAGALTEGRGNSIAAALAFVGYLNAALQG